jgi:hypothetical protein
VKLPDGKPAKGAEIIIHGLYLNETQRAIGKTDTKGELKVVFDDAKALGDNNGYGTYEFAARFEKYAWAKSSFYLWAGTEKTGEKWKEGISKLLKNSGSLCIEVLPESSLNWDVQLAETITKTVRVVDGEGRPIKGLNMRLKMDFFSTLEGEWMNFYDLGKVKTDDNGMFAVDVQPGRTYSLYNENYEYLWNGARHTIMPVNFLFGKDRGGEEFKFIRNRREEVTIRVRDFDTKEPLTGACINARRAADDNKTVICLAKTNKDGIFYSDEFRPETMIMFGAGMDGYHEEWLDIDSFSPGGSYEFELKKKDDF